VSVHNQWKTLGVDRENRSSPEALIKALFSPTAGISGKRDSSQNSAGVFRKDVDENPCHRLGFAQFLLISPTSTTTDLDFLFLNLLIR